MLIQDLLNETHVLYENNLDYPDINEEDFLTRMTLANIAIRTWATMPGMRWRELFTTLSDTLDASGEFAVTNFSVPAGKLKIGGTYYSYLSADLVQEDLIYSSSNIYTFIGAGDNAKLKVYPNPGAQAFETVYYRTPYLYESGADTTPIEMSNPMFIAYFINMRLFLDDGDNDRASVAAQSMEETKEGMIMTNLANPVYTDSKQEDHNFDGFGN